MAQARPYLARRIRAGFTVAALFDTDPAVIGTRFGDDLVVVPLSEVALTCNGLETGIDFRVIATNDEDAQDACDAFTSSGIRSCSM